MIASFCDHFQSGKCNRDFNRFVASFASIIMNITGFVEMEKYAFCLIVNV